MKMRLFLQSIMKFLFGVMSVGGLIFISAGTCLFTNGWLLMGILFVPMFLVGILLLFVNPELLQKRLSAKETQKEQKTVVKLCGLMFSVGFIVSGMDFRFRWSVVPKSVTVGAAVVFIISYVLYAEVFRENTYLSRRIGVEENQTVVDSGLYGIVRHPMYAVSVLMFLAIPLILGSIYAFFVFLTYPFILIKRIKAEEKFLEQKLIGYRAYQRKVRYCLIPFIW